MSDELAEARAALARVESLADKWKREGNDLISEARTMAPGRSADSVYDCGFELVDYSQEVFVALRGK